MNESSHDLILSTEDFTLWGPRQSVDQDFRSDSSFIYEEE